jgi:hypothetical protein
LVLAANDREGAREHLARAAELGSANPKVYYDCATMLQNLGEREAKLIPLLLKAVELDPGFTKARLYLGLNLAGQQKFEEAIKHLTQIKRMNYDDGFVLFQTLADAYQRTGKQAEAVEAAERAKIFARNDDEKRSADRLLEYLKTPPRPAPVVVRVPESKQAEEEKAEEAVQPAAPPVPRVVERPPQPTSSTIEGILEQVDCLGKRARLRLRFGGRQVRLVIQNPDMVEIRGVAGGKIDFACGVQPPRRVAILYDPKVDGELGTIGSVRSMEFK